MFLTEKLKHELSVIDKLILKTKRLSANREVGYTYSIVSKIEYLL
jgi:hypothetical protein